MADKLPSGAKKLLVSLESNTDSASLFDFDLAAHVLTDKEEYKILPCRDSSCRRPCVVTRFAAPIKVACRDHKSTQKPVSTDFDRSKEAHVLTDKPKTKEVPCRSCKRPCVVTTFMAADKVACNDCRKVAPRPMKSSKITKDANGRHREEVTVSFATPTDLEWSEFIVSIPFIDREYTQAEWAEGEAERLAQLAANNQLAEAQKQRRAAEEELEQSPDPAKLSQADAKQKAAKRREELSALVSESTSRETEASAATQRHRARRDELSRIAWIRAALNANWTLEGHTLSGIIDGISRSVTLPSNYLDAENIREAIS